MGMKKYLLVVFILLIWTGVDDLYGQPTAKVEFEKEQFCESEKVGGGIDAKMSIDLTGVAPFDFDYYINYNPDDNTFEQMIPVRNHNAYTYTTTEKLAESKVITVMNLSDSGGAGNGTITGAVTSIIIDALPSPVIDPAYKTCRTEITLTAEPGGDYTDFEWFYTAPGTGTFIAETINEATFKADASGSFDISYKVINGACVDELDTQSYTITDVAEPSATFSLLDDRICSDESTSLEVKGDGPNRYPLTLDFSDNKGNTYSQVLNTAEESIPVAADSPTIFTMNSLVDNEGCVASQVETLNLMVDTKPAPAAGVTDNEVCGSETTLMGQLTNATTNNGVWSVVDKDGSGLFIDDADDVNSMIEVIYADQWAHETYMLRLTETVTANSTCTGFDEVEVEFYKKPGVISLGADTTVYNEKEIIVNSVGLQGMPLDWSKSSGIDVKMDEEDPNLILVGNLSKGENKLVCTVNNGTCPEVLAEKLITVNDIYETTGFSPNADGVNDFFIIGGAHNVENNKLTVFDITGEVVFQTNDFCYPNTPTQLGWSGQKKDGKTEDGTYYYIFEGDDIEPIKSYLIIKGSR
jgi:gliding motility-associated-like protein